MGIAALLLLQQFTSAFFRKVRTHLYLLWFVLDCSISKVAFFRASLRRWSCKRILEISFFIKFLNLLLHLLDSLLLVFQFIFTLHIEILNALIQVLVLWVLLCSDWTHHLNKEFDCGKRSALHVHLLQEFLINFCWVNWLNRNWEFKAIIETKLELPPLFNDTLLLLFYLLIFLNNMCTLSYHIKGIIESAIEEQHTGFLQ
jgi:hypothetical protein